MTSMKKKHFACWPLFSMLILFASPGQADPAFWQDISAERKTATTKDDHTFRFRHRRLQLEEPQLNALIEQAQYQTSSTEISLSLPLPDGGFIAVRLVPTKLLAEPVKEMYPHFRTWRIEADDQSIISGRAELTELGFHAMLRTSEGDQIFIEPEQRSTSSLSRNYHSHSRRANASLHQSQQRFSCGTLVTPDSDWQAGNSPQRYARSTDQKAGESLLTYELAVAATGEYTQAFGGTKDAAFSAITQTINRVNEIFEQELAIHLKLVSDTNTIHTDPATDPYTNGNASLLIVENKVQLNKIIGSQNYDIGHVLGAVAGGDGLASFRSVCSSRKAQGTTSSSFDLLSNAFIVDFVAHELGHQLGAGHTFNADTGGSCSAKNRIVGTTYEPGSGSTIMSYAGICGSNNIQANADPHLHSKSIEQILNFTRNGTADCADETNMNNQLPTVSTQANHQIPARTPFILEGSATDNDGDALQYGWDQIDAGDASPLGVDTANNALIKSSKLSNSGIRNIPNLTKLLTQSQVTSHGESLPRSTRKLNFRLAVRDGNKDTAGGVVFADTRLHVTDTGQRFEIIAPTSNIPAGTQEISWNVAGTDQPPINCSHVDIAYTNNQGKTFTNLLLKTPNDGSATVQLNQTAKRIRVKCNDNIFFALSGTKPHIATFSGDSDQGHGSGNVDEPDRGDDGGGGSLPIKLTLILGLLTVIRRYSITQKRKTA